MKAPYISIILICLCVIVYFLEGSDEFMIYFGLNAYFFGGAYHQLLSSMFLHGGLEHLAMNCVMLYAFGDRIERALGAWQFALLYIIGGMLTSALSLSYIFINPSVNLIGASGAICVLLGFLAFYSPYMRKGLFVAVLAMSFAPLLLGVNVAWYAHLFGFGVGFGFGFLRLRFFRI